MSKKYKRHAEGEAFEKALGACLRAAGYRTFGEAINQSNGRAPLVRGATREDSYAMADIPAVKNGRLVFWDSKWKSGSFVSKHGNTCTGIDVKSLNDYMKHERDFGAPSAIVFCHRRENEIRCGTLAQLQRIEAYRCRESHYEESKEGMVNWHYEKIPLWMTYDVMEQFIYDHHNDGVLPALPDPPIEFELARTDSRLLAGHMYKRHVPPPVAAPVGLVHGYSRPEHTGSAARVVVSVEPAFMRTLGAIGDRVTCHLNGDKFPGIIVSGTLVAVDVQIPACRTVYVSKGVA